MAEKPTCGIIMPISTLDGCSEKHWIDVLEIIKESCVNAGFESSLVSDSKDSGVIQKRIVNNTYNSDIIVADVSGKNPNVMFELGMRLAFDRPAIIIKDDKTGFSFDTGIIEHIPYPRDLHYYTILKFKEVLSNKILETHKAAKNPDYSTFLKHLGNYKIKNIESTEIGGNELMLKAIEEFREELGFYRYRAIQNQNELLESDLKERVEFFVSEYQRETGLEDKHLNVNNLLAYLSPKKQIAELPITIPQLKQAITRWLSVKQMDTVLKITKPQIK